MFAADLHHVQHSAQRLGGDRHYAYAVGMSQASPSSKSGVFSAVCRKVGYGDHWAERDWSEYNTGVTPWLYSHSMIARHSRMVSLHPEQPLKLSTFGKFVAPHSGSRTAVALIQTTVNDAQSRSPTR